MRNLAFVNFFFSQIFPPTTGAAQKYFNLTVISFIFNKLTPVVRFVLLFFVSGLKFLLKLKKIYFGRTTPWYVFFYLSYPLLHRAQNKSSIYETNKTPGFWRTEKRFGQSSRLGAPGVIKLI